VKDTPPSDGFVAPSDVRTQRLVGQIERGPPAKKVRFPELSMVEPYWHWQLIVFKPDTITWRGERVELGLVHFVHSGG
jgi:hypothetical protein